MVLVGTGGQASLRQHTGKSKCRQAASERTTHALRSWSHPPYRWFSATASSNTSDGDGTDVLDKEPAGTEPHDEESVRSELTDNDSELPEAIVPPHPSILPGEWHDSFREHTGH